MITASSLAFIGSIVYAKYDSRFKHFLETNIPYSDLVEKLFSDAIVKAYESIKKFVSNRIQKVLDKANNSNSVNEKSHVEKSSSSDTLDPTVGKSKENTTRNVYSEDNKHADEIKIIVTDPNKTETISKSEIEKNISTHEDALVKTILKVKQTLGETINAYRLAANYIKFYTKRLNETHEYSGYDIEAVSKEVIDARKAKEKILSFARKKAAEMRTVFENLKSDAKRLSELGVCHTLIINSENLASKCLLEFEKAEDEMKATEENEAIEVDEYEKVLFVIQDLFERELEIFLNYKLQGNDEDDFNVLVTHAIKRIEQLDQQIIRLQESEKQRIDKEVKIGKMLDELDTEKQGCLSILSTIIESRLASLKIDFEDELHKLLIRQLAAHTDYLRRCLELQDQELNKKHRLELEEKLLHRKEVFMLETSENIARLKGITEYLKRMNECNKSTEKVKALWLTCQALCSKITTHNLKPLGNDVTKIKTLVDEENDFVHSVIDCIPAIALSRGVFTAEILKQRFENVKKVCQKVVLIDETNDSLYRYFLSYLQSFLIIDTKPTREDLDKGDVDTSKLDTLDILQRITYFLQNGNLEQSLHYAKQLKGEPRVIAEDWINEFTHLLETQLALKALLAYAAAISVQAYH